MFAARHAAYSGNSSFLLVAQPDGVLIIGRHSDNQAWFMPIQPHERLIGVRVTDGFSFALLRVYADFCLLDLKQYSGDRSVRPIFERRLAKEDPLAEGRFERTVLPHLSKPGSRQRYFAYAPTGLAVDISELGTRPYDILAHSQVIKCTQRHIILRRNDGRVVICAGESGHSIAKFAVGLRPGQVLRADDVVYDPASTLLAVRKEGAIWSFFSHAGGQPTQLPDVVMLSEGDKVLSPRLFSMDKNGRSIPGLEYVDEAGQPWLFCDGKSMPSERLSLQDFRCDDIALAYDQSAACLEIGEKGFVERVMFIDRSLDRDIVSIKDMRAGAIWLRD